MLDFQELEKHYLEQKAVFEEMKNKYASYKNKPSLTMKGNPSVFVINGPITKNAYDIPYAVDPDKLQLFLDGLGGSDGSILINCYGGSIWGAAAMRRRIVEYQETNDATITFYNEGIQASAATYISLGAKRVVMAPDAQYMIHLASGITMGNRHDIYSFYQSLENWDKAAVAQYAKRTGESPDELDKEMTNDKWMGAEEALKRGFVDEIADFVIPKSENDDKQNSLEPNIENHLAEIQMMDDIISLAA